MKYDRNGVIQLLILSGLGLAVVLSLVIPQQFQRDQDEPLPEISVVIREPDGSGWSRPCRKLNHPLPSGSRMTTEISGRGSSWSR